MDDKSIEAAEVIPASRKLGPKEARALLREASRVIVAKGKKVEEFKPGGSARQEHVEKLLGPTGNLRAPTIKVGKTLLVGFDQDSYQDVMG